MILNFIMNWLISRTLKDKSLVNDIFRHPSMALPGSGAGEIKLYKIDKYFAVFQKKSGPIQPTIISYPYALTVIPDRNNLKEFIHQIAIERNSYMSREEKPFLGIMYANGHTNLGNYLGELTDEAVLKQFEEILTKTLGYKGNLEFLENIKPVNLQDF